MQLHAHNFHTEESKACRACRALIPVLIFNWRVTVQEWGLANIQFNDFKSKDAFK